MFVEVYLLLVFLAARLFAAPVATPSVKLDNGTFYGKSDGNVQRFYGISFAKPPVGDLRFRLPQTVPSYSGTFTATDFGLSCPQQDIKLPILTGIAADAANYILSSIYGQVFPDSEDCLTLNVVKPATATSSSKLPVVVWIFGGGFQLGSPTIYDGGVIVERSIDLKMPVVYVSINYRLAGFGFLPGKEVKDAGIGNLGLHDQREAFRWIHKYINQFGGDPQKVTIWGESAGAISASLHMVSNGGDTQGLFRAAFMESGAPIPVGDITNGQKYYDTLITETGCSSAADTLACLRTVPYSKLKAAINLAPGVFAYQSLNLAWVPRVDGVFLTDNPQKLLQQGKVANIPYVTGNNDDEGTLFSLSTTNITTTAQLKTWMQTVFDPVMTSSTVDKLMDLYPHDITQGSPYDTSILNAITPQFKRIAAFQGDAVFHGPRRWLLGNTVPKNPNVWSYLSKRFKALPVLGSVHASDILNVYGGGEMTNYLIRFASTLDPNGNGLFDFQWPRYDLQSRQLLTFLDGLIPLDIQTDTFREEPMAYLVQATLAAPI
ncbi:carotenoid ester lipase precursor [Crepidotus variabilis]|uniref:Carboxylic ester hydrolase n=1 Tax=Crepidotus variabilis TaxID=179855 RepID=A0A9P6E6J2_9AGAR|nr:carotenoid ester lipase precursor [Crepidotus variabilis]